MQLSAPFFKLPLRFDAERLAAEVAQFTVEDWRPHPQGVPGNSALPFIARYGDPLDDGVVGPMQPTPHLARCPYVMQVMASLDVTLGRSRLMRLDARAEASPHVDLSYYWQRRVRVHVPVVTFPDVEFLCGDASTHMAAGDCWIFDTWREHNVLNPANAKRIHLVIDTVGSARFWEMVERGGAPVLRAFEPGSAPALRFESSNYPVVMHPAEMSGLWESWMADARAGKSPPEAIAAFDAALQPIFRDWRAAWAQFDARPEGWPEFASLRSRVVAVANAHMRRVTLPNEVDLADALGKSLAPALMNTDLACATSPAGAASGRAARGSTQAPELGQAQAAAWLPPAAGTAPVAAAVAHGTLQATPAARVLPPAQNMAPPVNFGGISVQWNTPGVRIQQAAVAPAVPPRIARPLIIVAAPRSGSSLLFETLARGKDLYTVGGESHSQFESIASLRPAAHDFGSNRLAAADATPAIVADLRARFGAVLRDRDGHPPGPGAAVRMLEKTPKNALRVPFLQAAFPDAQFVYLFREPEDNVSSLIEGWDSGRFITYPDLPGWRGRPWSFLLVPGWRDLVGATVPAIAAAQWQRTQTALLDDLHALPPSRVHALTYRQFLATPDACIRDICQFAGVEWDRPLPPQLPLSRHTVSEPHPDKWRQREALIAPYRPALDAVAERARAFVTQLRAASTPTSVAST